MQLNALSPIAAVTPFLGDENQTAGINFKAVAINNPLLEIIRGVFIQAALRAQGRPYLHPYIKQNYTDGKRNICLMHSKLIISNNPKTKQSEKKSHYRYIQYTW